jgi:hypothetical protein
MLSDAKIKSAKAKDKPCKMNDGQGLYLQVAANGGSGGASSTASTTRRN